MGLGLGLGVGVGVGVGVREVLEGEEQQDRGPLDEGGGDGVVEACEVGAEEQRLVRGSVGVRGRVRARARVRVRARVRARVRLRVRVKATLIRWMCTLGMASASARP